MDAKRQWILVTALVGVAILVAGFMFIVRPQYDKASKIDKQAKVVSEQTQQLRTKLQVLKDQQTQLPVKQAQLASLGTKVPATVNLADLTRQLQAAAQNLPTVPVAGRVASNDAHVDLSLLSPSAPAPLAASTGSSSSTSTSTSTTASTGTTGSTGAVAVQQIPLSMTVSGTFFNLESFFTRLESLPRTVLIDGFDISYQGSPQDDTKPGTGELTVSITARAFVTTGPLTTAPEK